MRNVPGTGLGIVWFVPIIASFAASVAAAAAQKKILGAGGQELSAYEYQKLQEAEEREKREKLILIAGAGVLAVFVLVAVTR